MRTRRVVTVLAAAGLLAATVTGAASRAVASTPAQACTPNWKLVATPTPPPTPPPGTPDTQLSGVAVVSAKDVWFPGMTGGEQYGGPQPWVLHWNGRSLKPSGVVPEGPFTQRDVGEGGSFDSSADGWVLGTSQVLPVGYPQYAARWHDGQWTITPLAVSSDPTSSDVSLSKVAAVTPGNAWAVGGFYHGRQAIGALIEHWDGTQWNIVPNPASSQAGAVLNAITVVSASDIWAVGQQPAASGHVPLTEHWDGTAWSIVPVPAGSSPSKLLAVSADGADDVWAVGAQTEPGTSDTGINLAEHWDGTAWSVVTGLPDLGNSELQQVYAASPTDVWATVYAPRTDTDLGVDNFLHFDGTSWTTVPVPGPHEYGLDYEYAGIDGTGSGNIWAAGYSIHPGRSQTPLIAHLSCG
jgi:hypothetical protein